jgi:hypothetical protein
MYTDVVYFYFGSKLLGFNEKKNKKNKHSMYMDAQPVKFLVLFLPNLAIFNIVGKINFSKN